MVELTKKEKIVLELLMQGLSRKEIAFKMGVLPTTAATHIINIYKKKGVHSAGELMQIHIKKLQEKIKSLEKEIKQLEPYKKRWEYLRERAFAERNGDR